MPHHDDLHALFAFNRWADARVVATARQLTPEQYTQAPAPGWSSVRATLVHLGGALRLWNQRLDGQPVTGFVAEADAPTVADAERLLHEAQAGFERRLATLTPEALAAPFTWQSLRGDVATVPLWAIYRHVANHATYHRGQIASKLGRLGVAPPVTDFVYWVAEQGGEGR